MIQIKPDENPVTDFYGDWDPITAVRIDLDQTPSHGRAADRAEFQIVPMLSSFPEKKKMPGASRLPTIAVLLLGLTALQPIEARAFELTGAWASQTDLCPLVFTKKGNQVVFTALSDLFGSGFIIDGDRISGKNTKCTIKSKKQVGDSLELSAACATSIMTSGVRFNLKVIDDNNLDRMFPEIAGMTLKYSRCSL